MCWSRQLLICLWHSPLTLSHVIPWTVTGGVLSVTSVKRVEFDTRWTLDWMSNMTIVLWRSLAIDIGIEIISLLSGTMVLESWSWAGWKLSMVLKRNCVSSTELAKCTVLALVHVFQRWLFCHMSSRQYMRSWNHSIKLVLQLLKNQLSPRLPLHDFLVKNGHLCLHVHHVLDHALCRLGRKLALS